MSDIIYTFKNNAYFNITNRCTCKCIFCIRNEHEAIGEATELWHDTILLSKKSRKPSMLLILQIIRKPSSAATENPTCAYDNLIAAAKYMKEKHPEVLLRVNTNGLGELFNKKPIAEEMAKYIDAVSISLNAPTAERYQEVTQPCFEMHSRICLLSLKNQKLFSSVQFSVVSYFTGRNRCFTEDCGRDGDSVEG